MFDFLKDAAKKVGDKAKGVKDKGKQFAIKKMMERQLKDAPKQQREMMMKAVEKNPELFEKIAKEIKEKMDAGQNQMSASMQVMKKYQSQIQNAMK